MPRARFGLFDFNSDTGELLREGRPVRLQAQPAKLLALLIAARGEVVTRESLRDALWTDTAVDFDRGLNFAVAQVRTALGDSADSPSFIRTVPKRGYQFIAPLAEPAIAVPPAEPSAEAPGSRRRIWVAIAAAMIVAALGFAAVWNSRPKEIRIAVARFDNETGNPSLDRFSDTITDSVVAGFTSQTSGRYGIIGNAAILRRPRKERNLDEIASTLHVQYVVLGQVQQEGSRMRVLAHLIRLPEKTHLKVSRLYIDPAVPESQLAARIIGDFSESLALPAPATN